MASQARKGLKCSSASKKLWERITDFLLCVFNFLCSNMVTRILLPRLLYKLNRAQSVCHQYIFVLMSINILPSFHPCISWVICPMPQSMHSLRILVHLLCALWTSRRGPCRMLARRSHRLISQWSTLHLQVQIFQASHIQLASPPVTLHRCWCSLFWLAVPPTILWASSLPATPHHHTSPSDMKLLIWAGLKFYGKFYLDNLCLLWDCLFLCQSWSFQYSLHVALSMSVLFWMHLCTHCHLCQVLQQFLPALRPVPSLQNSQPPRHTSSMVPSPLPCLASLSSDIFSFPSNLNPLEPVCSLY